MAQAKRVTTKTSGRYYIDADGQRYWSVTTQLGDGVPKKALVQWAGNEAAQYVVDALKPTFERTLALLNDINLSTVYLNSDPLEEDLKRRISLAINTYTTTSALPGQLASGDEALLEEAYNFIRLANIRTRDTAGRDGTKAHDMIEQYILASHEGSSWDWSARLKDENKNVKQIIARFQDFERDWEPDWEATELTVYNATEGYAGSLDFIARIPALGDGLTLGDFKSGRGVFPETALQMAAYRHAETASVAGNKATVPMPQTERAIVVHMRPDDPNSYKGLHPDSYYEIIPMDTGEEVFNMFKYAAMVAYFTREGSKWQHDPITHEQAMAARFTEGDTRNAEEESQS